MRMACVVAVVLGAAWAEAQKTVVVAAGDCSDPSLISGAKDFRDTASKLLGAQLMEGEVVLDIMRPRPTRSLQDIERQVESARALFYSGHSERALELVERALVELERASPEVKPWSVNVSAWVLQGLLMKNLDRQREMNEAFRRIIRLDPTYKLDPDAHPPSTVAALEALKRDLNRVRKSSLSIRVETGSAATVFIDGQPMGATPLKVDLVPGTYRVSLISNQKVSFPHRVEVPRDSKLNVDLAFEGSLGQQTPLCLSSSDDGAAIKLAQLVTAERVIVLRNTAKRGAPPYVSGSLYDLSSAQQERSGSVQPELLANLATFLVTGKEQQGVRRTDPEHLMAIEIKQQSAPTDVPLKQPEPVAPPAAVPPPPAPPTVEHQEPLVAATTQKGQGSVAGVVGSFVLMGAGVGAGVVGGLVFAGGAKNRTRFEAIKAPGGKLQPYNLAVGKEAVDLMGQIDANQTMSFALIGSGVGAVAAGLVGAMLFWPGATVVVSPEPGGATLSVSGQL